MMKNIFILVMILLFCNGNTYAQKWGNKTTSLSGKRILVYTKNDRGFRHDNVPNSKAALLEMGKTHGFGVDTSSNPNVFTTDNLKRYNAIVFSNTTASVFDTDEQRIAFMHFIQAGGGFVGIHSAGDTEPEWSWYIQLVGGVFYTHPEFQAFSVHVIDNSHPSTAHFPAIFEVEDELYLMKKLNPTMRVLMMADFSSPNFKGTNDMPITFGQQYPCCWCNTFDGGKQWYTALGHDKDDWHKPEYREHILGGLSWVIASKLDYKKAYSTKP